MASGWAIQDYKHYNPVAARGIVLREVPLQSGRCDYLLLVDRAAVGVIEVRREGTKLFSVADQSGCYAGNLPPFLQEGRYPVSLQIYWRGDVLSRHARFLAAFALRLRLP